MKKTKAERKRRRAISCIGDVQKRAAMGASNKNYIADNKEFRKRSNYIDKLNDKTAKEKLRYLKTHDPERYNEITKLLGARYKTFGLSNK